jgi:Synergist-CTERM protein sorting domain-containing protein
MFIATSVVSAADYYAGGADGWKVGTYGSKAKVRVKSPKSVFDMDAYKAVYDPFADGTATTAEQTALRGFTQGNAVLIAAEGINKMIGRTEWLTLEMEKIGTTVVVIPDDGNIYDVPEYSHLKDTMDDGYTRITIPGTISKPIIVTRTGDVLRTRGSDRFEMIHDFAKLYLEVGIKRGGPAIPKGRGDTDDTYDFYGHLSSAYENSKAQNLWPGTKMMESFEEYFAEATMVYWEVTPEYPTWRSEGGPVSTREEMSRYDPVLWTALVEVYPEYEFISPYSTGRTGTPYLPIMAENDVNMPWYKNHQVNEYDIDGNRYPPLAVVEANMIDYNMIELIFNRDVAHEYEAEARNAASYVFSWNTTGPGVSNANLQKTFRGYYHFKRVTFVLNANEITQSRFYNGSIGMDIGGVTSKDIDDPARPWLKTGVPSAEGSQTTPATPGANAIEHGTFITAADQPSTLNGTFAVNIPGAAGIRDWSGNSLATTTVNVQLKPWYGNILRTPIRGVYVYGDREVRRESMELAGTYIDAFLANNNSNRGQRLADGVTIVGGGTGVVAYGNHPALQPRMRTQGGHYGLYVEGWGGSMSQTTEYNLLRDKARTKYRNEFILGHEFGHGIDSGMVRYERQADAQISAARLAAQAVFNTRYGVNDLWYKTYPGSNRAEYFASLATLWFSTMRESADGTHNGTWYPQNTRDELYRYDPVSYAAYKYLYYEGNPNDPDDTVKDMGVPGLVGTPWESHTTPNIYDIDGSLYNPPTEAVGTEVTMAPDGGAIDALIAVVDRDGAALRVSSIVNSLANTKVFNDLLTRGIEVFEVFDGKLLIKGAADEPFEVELELNAYTPLAEEYGAVAGSERVERTLLRFISTEDDDDDDDGPTIDLSSWTKELTDEAAGTYLLRVPLGLTSAETAQVTGIAVTVTDATVSGTEAVFEDGQGYLLVTLTTATPDTAVITGIDFSVGSTPYTYSFSAQLDSIRDETPTPAPPTPPTSGGGSGGCAAGAAALTLCVAIPFIARKKKG